MGGIMCEIRSFPSPPLSFGTGSRSAPLSPCYVCTWVAGLDLGPFKLTIRILYVADLLPAADRIRGRWHIGLVFLFRWSSILGNSFLQCDLYARPTEATTPYKCHSSRSYYTGPCIPRLHMDNSVVGSATAKTKCFNNQPFSCQKIRRKFSVPLKIFEQKFSTPAQALKPFRRPNVPPSLCGGGGTVNFCSSLPLLSIRSFRPTFF